MFGQLLFVRLRAAENAFRDGRIDEAYRLASAPDLRAHPRGVAVLAGLTEKFIARAREHYRSDKFTEALMDLDRAEVGGVMKPEIDELRGYVRVVAIERDRRDASRRDRIQAAQKRIERGSLAAGRDMLEQAAAHDPAAQAVIERAAGRAQDASRALEQAERFLRAGQHAQAAERLARAKSLDPHAEQVACLESELVKTVLGNVEQAIRDGNLTRAEGELANLGELGNGSSARLEAAAIVAGWHAAGAALRRGDYGAARQQLMAICRKIPKVQWLSAVTEQLKQLDEIHAAVCAGPLGDSMPDRNVGPGAVFSPAHDGRAPRRFDETVALPVTARAAEQVVADRYLLLVDGGGSYLVIRGGEASIGRAASEIPADLPIISDLAERHANITRVEDDYFIMSARDLEVGGRRTQHALLRDGDRVVLGKKAKFTFRLPSRKSSTAVLELSDTTKAPNDVRRVVLLNQHAIVSNSPTAHVFCRHAGCSLVLFDRSGSLWVRAKSDGHVDTEAKLLLLGEPVEIGGASLVLAPWKLSAAGPVPRA